MAIETQKILSVDTNGAVTSVRELKDEINKLRDAWINAEEGSEEYDAITKKLIDDQTKLNQVMNIGKTQVSAASGSYNALVNQMAALKKVWRETTSEVQRNQLGNKINDINNQLKELDSSIGNNQRRVGAYEQALQTLNKQWDSQKQELAALKTALDNLDPSSQEYIKAFERAAEITHNMSERQEILRMSANDLGTQISNVANIGAGMMGAFNAVQGVMTLAGTKSENLTKAMADLQAGIAIVQGLKGIEGMNKSLKAYANWAAKAYDRIKDMIAGHKAETKEIQTTTTSLEANAAANNEVAGAEANATAGAGNLATGMKGADTATKGATASAIAWKAALVSIGIGVFVALISGLISMLGKLGSKAKELREKDLAYASLSLEKDKERLDERLKGIEREGEEMRAIGKSELEILDHLEKKYSDVFMDLVNGASAAEKIRNSLQNAMGPASNSTSISAQYEAFTTDANGVFTTVTKTAKVSATEMLAAVKYYTDNGSMYMREMLINDQDVYDKMLKKGVKTYQDMAQLSRWYYGVLNENKEAFLLDPLKQTRLDINNEAKSIIHEAEDAMKSESQLERERYQSQLTAYTWTNKQLQALADAHNKKMYEIYKSTYRSVLEALQTANQERRQNLQTNYERELRDLKEIGAEKMSVTYTTEDGITKTVTAAEALRLKYAKESAKLELEIRTKAIEDAIKEINGFSSTVAADRYNRLEAAGISNAKALAAKQEEAFENSKFTLEKQVEYWEKLLDEIKDNEFISAEERIKIQEKLTDARNKLEKSQTDYLVQQIQTRKKAMDEEIDKIEKEYDEYAKIQARANATPGGNYGENASFGGFMKYSFRGDAKTFQQGLQEIDDTYKIEIDQLQEMVEIYKKAAHDINLSEEERTAAKKKEAEARGKITQLEEDRELEHKNFVLQNYEDIQSTILDVAQSVATILDSIYDTIQSSMQRQVNEGKMTEEEMEKQMEKYRWIQYTSTVITTARNAVEAYGAGIKSFPYNLPLGQILGIAGAAAAIAQGVAQLAAIKAASKSSTLGNAAAMQPTSISQTEYQPDYSANLTNRSDTEYLRNALSQQPIWVSVKDIDSAQNRVRVVENESSF